jgi:hypothetical protein
MNDTRYTTIPPGLFPSIIVTLSNSSQSSENNKWTLVDQITKKRYKDEVSFNFLYDEEFVQVNLIAQTQWIEIRITELPDSLFTVPMIRKDVVEAIKGIEKSKTLLGQILISCTWPEFGFYCDRLHFAKYNNTKQLHCTGCCRPGLHKMKRNQLIWFEGIN